MLLKYNLNRHKIGWNITKKDIVTDYLIIPFDLSLFWGVENTQEIDHNLWVNKEFLSNNKGRLN